MTTFSDVLPATRSCPNRGIDWAPCEVDAGCPCSGVLTLKTAKKYTRYAVTEFRPGRGFGGRAFEVRKADGTVYHLNLDGSRSTCDCPGMSYDATRKADRRHGDKSESLGCNHLDALAAVVANGWLPHPGERPDDVGSTEIEEPAPESCGYCGGRGHVPGPTHDRYGYELSPRNLTCEYCGGSGVTEGGSRLLPHRRLNS